MEGIVYTESGASAVDPKVKYPAIPFGNFTDLLTKPWETADAWSRESMKLYWMITNPSIWVSNADIAKDILTTSETKYSRSFEHLYLINRIEGNGVLAANGEDWKRQHRIVVRAFGPKILKSLAPTMQNIVEYIMVDRCKQAAAKNEPIDVVKLFQYLSMEVIVATSLGGDTTKVEAAVKNMFTITEQFANPLLNIPNWHKVPTPTNKRIEKAFQELDQLIYLMIDKRKKERNNMTEEERGSQTMLDMLLEATDENDGSVLTEKEVRDNIMAFFLAGSDTTANELAWAAIHLAHNKPVYEKVRNEVDSVLGKNIFNIEDSDKFPYYNAFIQEVMRISPAVMNAIAKTPKENKKCGELTVPPGVDIYVSITGLGQDPKNFENPLQFNPDRFLPQNAGNVKPFTHIPFGAGRRMCLGKNFALQEMQITIIRLIQMFEFEPADNKEPWEDNKHPPSSMNFPILQPKASIRNLKMKLRN